MYAVDPIFWFKFLLLIAIVLLLLVSFNTKMRKWLDVGRKKFFSYNYINEKHKRIDRTLRIATIITILITFPINITYESINYWFLQPWFILFIFIVVSELVKVVMEWKYATNPNAYKLTTSQIIFNLILIYTLIKTNFFGLV